MIRPTISVIITVFNLEKYISECMESVLNQSVKDIEVICIDDASTDQSLAILHAYAVKDKRIRIIAQSESIGPSAARNIGYREAKGLYLYQIDGDDVIVDGALERMYSCAAENKLDFLTFSASAFADSIEIEKDVHHLLNLYIRKGAYFGVMEGMELFAKCIHNGDFLGNLCCIFLSKDFFDSKDMYLLDGLYASADNNFLFYLNAKRVMCIPDALYKRRFRENSIVTSKKTLIKFESMLVEFVNEISVWDKYTFDDYIDRAMQKYFASIWQGIISTYNKVVNKDVPLKLLPKYHIAKFMYENCIMERNTYWTNQTDETISKLRQYKNVIIYGAMDIANEVKNILERNQIFHYVFAVSDNTYEKSVAGKKVYNIDELEYAKEDAIVLIAVSKRHHSSIRKKLEILGFHNILEIE